MDDIRDIKAPVPLPTGAGRDGLLAGLGLAVLAGLAVWRWRRMRQSPARRELASLRRELADLEAASTGLADRDYYFRLSGLARRVLALRLGLAAVAMTPAELGPYLAALPDEERADAEALLARAEAACFAGRPVSAALRRADGQTAARLAARARLC
ncbi:hypothetical protein [Solidesulfovibrio sp.]|uniref:hypothetical protein n=1 Tax=Solidesulfovibrio sp. TaxID=2910990 RepID=UPI002623C168|nr:hypothetical protein [Solidesulfovibrio sp.]